MLLDSRWTEHERERMTSTDPLKFVDTKALRRSAQGSAQKAGDE